MGNGEIARLEHPPTALEVISTCARDPQVDVAKLQALLAMQERLEQRQAEVEFNQAMTRLQAKLPKVVRRRSIIVKGTARSKYAALEDIDEVTRPLMIAEGFSVSYETEEVEGKNETKVTCVLRHMLGHKERYSVTVPFDRSEFRTEAQSQGSTISFGKRYAFCNALNIPIVGEDNDGGGGYITQAQVEGIMDMLTEIGSAINPAIESGFLKYMGVKTVKEILASNYKTAIAALEAKRRKGNA